MEDIGPLTLVFLRTVLAAGVLWGVVRVRGLAMPRGRAVWGSLFVLGLLNNIIPFTLLFWGEIYISAGLASILNGLTPLFAVVLAHYMGKHERITPNRVLGLLLGIGGVAVLIGPGLLGEVFAGGSGEHGSMMLTLAKVALIVASCSYALAGIYARRFREYPPLIIATGQVTSSALMSLPLVLLIDHPFTHAFPVWQTWMSVAWLGILSTALAYAIYFRLLATAGSTNITLVTLLAPVTAILLGWLVLGEHLMPQHFAGMALIFAGLMAIDGRVFHSVKMFNRS
ncbi:MAG: transporter permease [Micavibrio sp.]|nr:transporter permease [Micavibrio sp.]